MAFGYTFKLVLFGDGGVGKTSLAQRYLTGIFADNTKITIGVEFHIKDVVVEGNRVKLQIWDFGGEERFRFILPTYCRGASGGIFFFDVTCPASLLHLDAWLGVVQGVTGNIPLLMVGTKTDLAENRAVDANEAMALARQRNLAGYAEVSAKTGINVESTFELITKLMVHRMLTSVS